MNGVRAGRKAAMPDCIGCRAWRRRGTKLEQNRAAAASRNENATVRVGRCDSLSDVRLPAGDEPATREALRCMYLVTGAW